MSLATDVLIDYNWKTDFYQYDSRTIDDKKIVAFEGVMDYMQPFRFASSVYIVSGTLDNGEQFV